MKPSAPLTMYPGGTSTAVAICTGTVRYAETLVTVAPAAAASASADAFTDGEGHADQPPKSRLWHGNGAA